MRGSHVDTRPPGQKCQGLRGSRRELVCKGEKFLPSAQTTGRPAATADGRSGSDGTLTGRGLKVTVTSSGTWTGTLASCPTSSPLLRTVTRGRWGLLAPLCPQGLGVPLGRGVWSRDVCHLTAAAWLLLVCPSRPEVLGVRRDPRWPLMTGCIPGPPSVPPLGLPADPELGRFQCLVCIEVHAPQFAQETGSLAPSHG